MLSLKTKETLAPWVPTGFCAFLSLLALGGSIVAQAWWALVFLSFLPMCFFFVGAAASHMQREIEALRKQVAQLEGHNLRPN